MRRAVQVLLATVTVAGIVFLFVLPGRTWLAQSRASAVAQRQEGVLSRENAALSQRVRQLQSSAYIEQVARQEYGLVMPGEHAYGILPLAASPTTLPSGPAPKPRAHSFWRDLEFWD